MNGFDCWLRILVAALLFLAGLLVPRSFGCLVGRGVHDASVALLVIVRVSLGVLRTVVKIHRVRLVLERVHVDRIQVIVVCMEIHALWHLDPERRRCCLSRGEATLHYALP